MAWPPQRPRNEQDEDAYADEQAQQVADVLKRAAEVAVPQSPRREATGLAQEDAEGGTASASSNIDIDVASQADNADPANKRRRLRSKPHVTDDSSSGLLVKRRLALAGLRHASPMSRQSVEAYGFSEANLEAAVGFQDKREAQMDENLANRCQ